MGQKAYGSWRLAEPHCLARRLITEASIPYIYSAGAAAESRWGAHDDYGPLRRRPSSFEKFIGPPGRLQTLREAAPTVTEYQLTAHCRSFLTVTVV